MKHGSAEARRSWGGLISNIPAGTNRSFLAEAFDASGTLRFQGRAFDVSISPQQTPPPTPYENETPLIDSVVAPTSVPRPEGAPLLLHWARSRVLTCVDEYANAGMLSRSEEMSIELPLPPKKPAVHSDDPDFF